MSRTFIAVRFPIDRHTAVLTDRINRLGHMGPAVRAVDANLLHVTLRFLGEVDVEVLDLIALAIEQATAGVDPFDLQLRGIGVFPHRRRPSVVWAGAEQAAQQEAQQGSTWPLHTIVDRLTEPLEALGFAAEDRPFRAHLTLARIKGRPPKELDRLLEKNAETELATFPVQAIDLMTSQLQARGPVYTVVRSIKLSSAGSVA